MNIIKPKATSLFLIMLMIMSGLIFSAISLADEHNSCSIDEEDRSDDKLFLWNCQINVSETNGEVDFVVIEEDTISCDGPPNDPNDAPNPPTSPGQLLDAYLDDGLSVPYDKMLVDSRFGPDPDFYKEFNLTVYYMGSSTITLTWNPDDLQVSEYLYVNLTDYQTGAFIADMKTSASYTFSVNFVPADFKIVCEKQAPPDVGVSSVITPSGSATNNTATPVEVELTNFCVQNLTNVPVHVQILNASSTIVYDEMKTMNLTPLIIDSITFPNWIPTDFGSYTVEACTQLPNDADNSNNCSVATVSINHPPTADFSFSPISPTTNEIVSFTDLSFDSDGSITSWFWDFNDGSTSTLQDPTHQFLDDGNYTVCLTVTDDDTATDTISYDIIVSNVPPVANFSYSPLDPSTADTVSFTDLSFDSDGSITSWFWDFNDGSTSTLQDPTHQFLDDGNYTVCLTVTDDDSDTNMFCTIIQVSNAAPVADFSYSPLHPNTQDTIMFTSLSTDRSIINYTWDFDDGQNSYQQNPSHSYSDDGVYNVTLVVTDDDDASSSTTKQIMVNNTPPTADFSFSPISPTTNEIVSFTDVSTDSDGSITSWFWDFNDGSTSTLQDPTHQFLDDGNYTVCLTVTDDDTATDTISYDIIVSNVPPVANFSYSPLDPSTADTVSFTDLSSDSDGSITSWFWDFNDGSTSTLQDPTHQFLDDGNYTVCLTVTDDDSDTNMFCTIIQVSNAAPVADFSYVPAIPTTNDTIVFTDLSFDSDGTINSWFWDFGNGNTSSMQNPTQQYTLPGDFDVNLTVTDDDGSTAYIQKIITVVINNPPVANFSFTPLEPSVGQTVIFTDLSFDSDGNILNWVWEFGDGSTSTLQNPTHQYNSSGSYSVTLFVADDMGANDTVSRLVLVDIQTESVIFPEAGWNFISIPFNQSKMKDQIFVKYNGWYYDWTMATTNINPTDSALIDTNVFEWNSLDQNYYLVDTLHPGIGYWLFSKVACEMYTEEVIVPDDSYITTFEEGWNTFGLPFDESLVTLDLTVIYDDIEYNWTDATTNNNPTGSPIIDANIFSWLTIPQSYQLTSLLSPEDAYWIFAYQHCILKNN